MVDQGEAPSLLFQAESSVRPAGVNLSILSGLRISRRKEASLFLESLDYKLILVLINLRRFKRIEGAPSSVAWVNKNI